jgi:peptidoglycan/xylan/chitin deacetylase (PgdA/CDA1 family)
MAWVKFSHRKRFLSDAQEFPSIRHGALALLAVSGMLALAGLSCRAFTPQRFAVTTTPDAAPKSLPVSKTLVPTLAPSQADTPTPSREPTAPPPASPTATTFLSETPSLGPPPEHAPALPPVGVHFITNGSRDFPAVALTFDLCQKPEYPAGFDSGIYQALLEAQAPATFFVGGDWARTHPDELQLLAANPLFEMGNHSWSHPDFPGLDEATLSAEILKTQDILYRMTGVQPRLFRLPAGLYDDLALSVIAYHGLYTIQWDVVTADPVYDNPASNINQIVRDNVQNGSIIIMHANGRGWHTAEALPEMIAFLREQGYRLVTVSDLLGME